jgi:hypothetical protein
MAASQLRHGFDAYSANALKRWTPHMSENIDGVRRASTLHALRPATMHALSSSLRARPFHMSGKRRAS